MRYNPIAAHDRLLRDAGTEDIFDGARSKVARRTCPEPLWAVARRKLDSIDFASVLSDVAQPPSSRLEKLKGDRAGQQSIRINEQYRVCFTWTAKGAENVEIADYH